MTKIVEEILSEIGPENNKWYGLLYGFDGPYETEFQILELPYLIDLILQKSDSQKLSKNQMLYLLVSDSKKFCILHRRELSQIAMTQEDWLDQELGQLLKEEIKEIWKKKPPKKY